jgi:hypothetical protein
MARSYMYVPRSEMVEAVAIEGAYACGRGCVGPKMATRMRDRRRRGHERRRGNEVGGEQGARCGHWAGRSRLR